jgi:flavin-dependent dehydrogenase
MKIAICGAGLVGSYLYRLLNQTGIKQVTIFDNQRHHQTKCGISPCAWVTSIGFEELIEAVGLDPEHYILQTFDQILMNEIKVSGVIKIIDKPKLINDLLAGVNIIDSPVRINEFDRIIDATGVARAYLPEINNDVMASCIQYRVFSDESLECRIHISNVGYTWCFPLSDNEYHIGAGSIMIPPDQMLSKSGWLENKKHSCSCSGKIRFTSPQYSLPFVSTMTDNNRGQVWGVGEAIGCVSPLSGEGIIPGLKSARLLLANWEDVVAYQNEILTEFEWVKKERSVVDKAMQGKRIGLLDAQILKNNTKRLSMNFKLNQALKLLRSLSQLDKSI